MKTGLLAAVIFLTTHLASAVEPDPFEVRAVAAAASEHTKEYSSVDRDSPPETVLLETTVLLDHTALLQASVEHEQGQPVILIKLTPAGSKRFGEITTMFLNKRIGLVLYGQLYCAPVVRSRILGGSLEIPGNFTEFEAIDLVRKLNRSVSL